MLFFISLSLSLASKCNTFLSTEGQSLVQYFLRDYSDSNLQSTNTNQLIHSEQNPLNIFSHKTINNSKNPPIEILPVPAEVQAMFDWAASKGVKWPKITYPVLFPPGYIGSIATDTIEPGEAIVTGPNDCLISARVAYQSSMRLIFESHKEIFGTFEEIKDDLVLCSYILSEKAKGPDSEIAAFLGFQPKDPNNIQDWDKSDLLELQDTDLIYDTEKNWEFHKEKWTKWKSVFEKYPERIPERFRSLEEFTWAVRLIETRTFGKFVPYTTFFPIGELLNHENAQSYYIYLSPGEVADPSQRYGGVLDEEDHDLRIFEKTRSSELSNNELVIVSYYMNKGLNNTLLNLLKTRALEIDQKKSADLMKKKTIRSAENLTESSQKEIRIMTGPTERYEKGAEVFMSYGRVSNRHLLKYYGFSLKVNHFNFLYFKVQLRDLFKNTEMAGNLSSSGFSPNSSIRFKLKEKWICLDLINTLRKLWWEKQLSIDGFFKPDLQNLDLEREVVRKGYWLLNGFQNQLQTTLEEDLRIMEGQISIRKHFAVLYRSQMKGILRNQIRFFKVLLDVLSEADRENLEKIKELYFLSQSDREKLERALGDYFKELGN